MVHYFIPPVWHSPVGQISADLDDNSIAQGGVSINLPDFSVAVLEVQLKKKYRYHRTGQLLDKKCERSCFQKQMGCNRITGGPEQSIKMFGTTHTYNQAFFYFFLLLKMPKNVQK